MKTLFMVTYDLKKPGRPDYTSLHKAIKECGDWLHPLESTWLLHTVHTPAQIVDHLTPHLDANDKLIVLKACTPGSTQHLTQDELQWLNARITA